MPDALSVFDKSPDRAASDGAREIVSWLLGGTDKIRSEGGKIFPKEDNEDQNDYAARIGRALLRVPAYPRAVSKNTGTVFAKEWDLGGDVPVEMRGTESVAERKARRSRHSPAGGNRGAKPRSPDPIVEGWAESVDRIDGRGTDFSGFLKSVMEDGLGWGSVGAFVDHPPMPEGVNPDQISKSDEEGRRPYVVTVPAGNILETQWGVVDGKSVLVLVRVLEPEGFKVREPWPAIGYRCEPQVRVFHRRNPYEQHTTDEENPNPYVYLEVWRKTAQGIPYVAEDRYLTPVAEIPYSEFPGDGPGCDRRPLMMNLAHLNLHHCRIWNEFDQRWRVLKIPFYYLTGATVDDGGNSKEVLTLKKTNGRAIVFTTRPAGESAFTPVEFTGTAIDKAWQEMKDLEDEMDREGMRPMQKDQAQTLGERILAKVEADSPLYDLAQKLRVFGENILLGFAMWRKWPTGGSVIPPDDFLPVEPQPAALQSLQAMRDSGNLSRRTLWAGAEKQGVMPEEFDPETEEQMLAEEAAGSGAADVEELSARVDALAAQVGSAMPLTPVDGATPAADASADPLAAAAAKGTDVQKTALNGAQISSMVEIVSKVAAGEVPRDAGVQILFTALPITRQQAEDILGDAGKGFVPASQEGNPPPAQASGGSA